MKADRSPNSPPPPSSALPRPAFAVAALLLYVASILGLRVLCHRWHWNEVLIVPLLAELILLPTPWTRVTCWKALLGRLLGLSLGNALFYRLYLIPVVYQGQDPWPEESLWLCVITAGQTIVAALALLASRKMRTVMSGH